MKDMNLSRSLPASGAMGWHTIKHSFSADVFIDIGPVDTDAFADQAEILPLLSGRLA
jgi:hypothetical protein